MTGRSFGELLDNIKRLEEWIFNEIFSALSEVLGHPLPYDDVLGVRDRMWEISPSLVRYDVAERTSPDLAAQGLAVLAGINASAKVTGTAFRRPITNFYQTDVISRA